MMRLALLPVVLALGAQSDLLSMDDQCESGTEDCALQALQHHASKGEQEVVAAGTAEKVKVVQEEVAEHGTKSGMTSKSEKKSEKKSFFDCNKDTGGTCSWFGCSKSRGADCKDGKCQCGPNLCARNGKCQIAEGYKMAKTTKQERDTGGSCRFFACDASRGPTHCDRNEGYKCFCAEGFYSSKGSCIPKLVQANPPQGADQAGQPQPFDWTKVDWTKIFQKNGWGATTDWSKIDWNKIYGGATGSPLGSGYGYGMPYGTPGATIPPYTPPSPYAYANPYGVPYWR